MIYLSVLMSVIIKNFLNGFFDPSLHHDFNDYTEFFLIYFIPFFIFAYQGIYTHRYDFWHENLLIIRSSFLAFIILFSILALSKNLSYSRIILTMTFLLMMILIPFAKFILKHSLFKVGIWQKKAKVVNSNKHFRREIFGNPYLGYTISRQGDYDTIFISSQGLNPAKLDKLVEQNICSHKEVIFTPLLDSYDFSRASIYNLFNSRTNLFVLENSLQSPLNRLIKTLIDYTIVLLALPFLFIIFLAIFVLIKLEEPRGSVLFRQDRAGQYGKVFGCYKFRSMRENSDEILKRYLDENPEEIEYYDKFHKYKNDPRITKIGAFLRKTSLDELPQLINVLKLEMSIVGPRPVPPNEHKESGTSDEDIYTIRLVKPGLTGLAQITGRETLNFSDRTKLNVWYVKNWRVYIDIIIILKTFKTVLLREGAS